LSDQESVPIVAIGDCLLVSIQIALHDELLEGLSQSVAAHLQSGLAKAVAIDLTSVGIIDSFTTRIINRIASMARLMGAHTVVSGIQPAVAMTMVDMGIELDGVSTFLTVDHALVALGLRGAGLARSA
jgi:rsbT antagonist protein RsbS